MEYIALPRFIRESTVLTREDCDLLCSIENFPTEEEVDALRIDPEMQELLNAFIGDEHTRSTHIELKAKTYLEKGEVKKAWLVLLL